MPELMITKVLDPNSIYFKTYRVFHDGERLGEIARVRKNHWEVYLPRDIVPSKIVRQRRDGVDWLLMQAGR